MWGTIVREYVRTRLAGFVNEWVGWQTSCTAIFHNCRLWWLLLLLLLLVVVVVVVVVVLVLVVVGLIWLVL